MTLSIIAEHCYAKCHLCWLSLMLSVTFKPLCWVSLCWMSLCWVSWRQFKKMLFHYNNKSIIVLASGGGLMSQFKRRERKNKNGTNRKFWVKFKNSHCYERALNKLECLLRSNIFTQLLLPNLCERVKLEVYTNGGLQRFDNALAYYAKA